MALFAWRDDYSVKVPSIDVQHHKLVDMLNGLHDGMVSGTSRERLAPLLGGLIEYTATHFAHEEELFAQYGYPDSAKHTQEHQDLVKKVLDFKGKFDKGSSSLTMELMMFLKNWLLEHILGSDKAYSAHLVERGAK
jgi:hemerythrin